MTNRKLIALAFATLILASIIYWLVQRDKSEHKSAPANSRSASPAVVSPLPSNTEAGGQLDLIARERQNATVWAKELLAQKHEEVFIKLWDQLRAGPDPASVLENFVFGEIGRASCRERVYGPV